MEVQQLPHAELKTKGSIKNSNVIKASCDFDYLAETFTLSLYSSEISFQPSSISVLFRKQSITATQYGKNEVLAPNNVFVVPVSFRKCAIDFFGFSVDRIFKIHFKFMSTSGKVFENVFTITLPVIKQSEYRFKPPGTCYPDESTRRICQQEFQMSNENSDAEIQKCILLEEFKLLSAIDRYKAYGYIEMLNLFLDIENSFELDLVQKCNLLNIRLEKLGTIRYKINVSLF